MSIASRGTFIAVACLSNYLLFFSLFPAARVLLWKIGNRAGRDIGWTDVASVAVAIGFLAVKKGRSKLGKKVKLIFRIVNILLLSVLL